MNGKGEADCVDKGLLVYFSTSHGVQEHLDAGHDHITLCLTSHWAGNKAVSPLAAHFLAPFLCWRPTCSLSGHRSEKGFESQGVTLLLTVDRRGLPAKLFRQAMQPCLTWIYG